jgi:asparagine N-glycosylation enzyme membrane subunit Stt3
MLLVYTMRILNSYSFALDVAGMWASGLCALHCLFVPILLSFTTFSGLVFLEDPWLENAILFISAILGMLALLPSYYRHHRKGTPVVLFIIGILVIACAKNTSLEFFETTGSVIGGTCMAVAHGINYRICKRKAS